MDEQDMYPERNGTFKDLRKKLCDEAHQVDQFDMGKIDALPILRLPSEQEIYWLANLLDSKMYHDCEISSSDLEKINGLVEQGMAAKIIFKEMLHRGCKGLYAATVQGLAFFTGLYEVETLDEALAKHRQK